jgi:hypothetical protein
LRVSATPITGHPRPWTSRRRRLLILAKTSAQPCDVRFQCGRTF